MVKKLNFDAMSVDEMWRLHEEIVQALSVRLTSEKRELDKRLAKLRREKKIRHLKSPDGQAKGPPRRRRKYPKVFPKFRNPDEPSESWSGRGKRPRWLMNALTEGHAIEEFMVANVDSDTGQHT